MRRPPGLWILLSAGVVWLSLQDVYGIRATSLIFGKTTTTTTTTTTTEAPEAAEEAEAITTELSNDPNATKPTLTGNPQLDYIWDPNLPKELNGYNLSDYPFYERVPDEIDFKCDGLHDGFYASVAHKCQVYHHCLYGTRYDFLCANYTAFDQKTFICHFASEVDCNNSKKFWHRNDALYKAASTTTIKPFVIYTPPPQQPSPITISPLAPAPAAPSGSGGRRPAVGRRRPFRRRIPQYEYYDDDYYDDYYEERPRSNRGRKRPRPRPRPAYEDEYDQEYEDDRYERRGSVGRRDEKRRPYDRRPVVRNRSKDRGKQTYEDEQDDAFEDEDVKPNSRRKSNTRKRIEDDYSEEDDYVGSRKQNKRRPVNDRDEEYDAKPFRKNHRRPIINDYEEDSLQTEDSRSGERPRKNEGRKNKPQEETRTIIKPVSGTIYDRPRVAPRIKLPVPKNEANKFAYKPIGTQTPANTHQQEDEEYYDDYDEEPPPKQIKNSRKPPVQVQTTSKFRPKNREENKKQPLVPASRSRPIQDSYESYESTSKESHGRNKRPISEEYYDDYEDEEEEPVTETKPLVYKNIERKPLISVRQNGKTVTTTTTTSTTTTEIPFEKSEQPIVRLIKRPFLPSRGGNPYSARGLQPVGVKAVETTRKNLERDEADILIEDTEQKSLVENDSLKSNRQQFIIKNNSNDDDDDERIRPAFKPSPVMIKVPVRPKTGQATLEENFQIQSEIGQSYDAKEFVGPRTTQKPKLPERDPLDINEEEYDVTLNDALNPTLPNLPVRGFSAALTSANDNAYNNNYQRPRYVLDPVLSPASTDYIYQAKPQRYQVIPQNNRDQLSNPSIDYKSQYSTVREVYRPRQVQPQTEVFYSRY